MSDKKHYKLAPGQGLFWDPTQPEVENQKLVGNQVKELDSTPAVLTAKRLELIIAVEEKEYEKYLKTSEANAANAAPVKKLTSAEDAKLTEKVKSIMITELTDSFNAEMQNVQELHLGQVDALKTEHEQVVEKLNTEIEGLKAEIAKALAAKSEKK